MEIIHNLDDYELGTILGEGKHKLSLGAFGTVRLAKSKSSGRFFAVKIMSKQGLIE